MNHTFHLISTKYVINLAPIRIALFYITKDRMWKIEHGVFFISGLFLFLRVLHNTVMLPVTVIYEAIQSEYSINNKGTGLCLVWPAQVVFTDFIFTAKNELQLFSPLEEMNDILFNR